MRLTSREINLIKDSVRSTLGDVPVYLFGSRVDESKRGGDIDLYIIAPLQNDRFRKTMRLKTRLEDLLHKPVDIVVSRDRNRPIEREAIKGIRIV
ncbi:nucleotidyltransferase family protein [Nitratifractor sp.]|uniref:nucleotidyltransferase family protein n=1 Tax=Nitratifractor sp. TaxID=2268144 RepID=UPI00345CE10C